MDTPEGPEPSIPSPSAADAASPTPAVTWTGRRRSQFAPGQAGARPAGQRPGASVAPNPGPHADADADPTLLSGSAQSAPFTAQAPLGPDVAFAAPTVKVRRQFGLPVVVLVAALSLALGIVLGVGGSAVKDVIRARLAEKEQSTALADAYTSCGNPAGVTLGDSNQSMNVDGKGTDDASGATIADISCVLTALDVPDYVLSQMDATRALDGTLSGSWDQYSASWNYHPDHGLNVEIHVTQDTDK